MIKQLKTRLIHQGFINLRLDIVRLPNGREAEYTVLEYPNAVAVVPLLPDNEVIMLRQYRYVLGKYTYEFPGGIVDEGEDFLSAAHREMEEEIGYKATNMKHLLTINPDTCLSTQRIAIYLATNLKQTHQKLEDTEVVELITVSLNEALAMVREGEITNADTIVGLQTTALNLSLF